MHFHRTGNRLPQEHHQPGWLLHGWFSSAVDDNFDGKWRLEDLFVEVISQLLQVIHSRQQNIRWMDGVLGTICYAAYFYSSFFG